MLRPAQFTRNADNFFLQVELEPQTSVLSFLLVSTAEDGFFELRLNNQDLPLRLKSLMPTTHHLFLYLLKNHNHHRSFRIDSNAQIHITVPVPNDLPIDLLLPTKPITDTLPLDLLDQQDEQLQHFFGKSKTQEAMDLDQNEDTGRTDHSQEGRDLTKKHQEERNRTICRQAEEMLRKGCTMGEVRNKLKLSDRSAFKMFRQFQKYRRVFSPEEGRVVKQNQQALKLLKGLLESNPHQVSAHIARDFLLSKGIDRPLSWLQRFLDSIQIVYYSEESGHSPNQ